MMNIEAPASITGIREIADRYDAFLIDQFGVLHDGTAPYSGAQEALALLAQARKRIILLSNSGKRSAPNEARLTRLGFGGWAAVLTSGEVAWSILAAEAGEERRNCLLLARDDDRSAIAGLPIDVTRSGADCDFVLIAGSEGDVRSLDEYRALLAPAAERSIPAYCTNPDKQMLTPGGLRFGAGRIAELYEELGGTVTWIGKPFPAIYDAARRLLPNIPAERILGIGDSVEHDIAGAKSAGLDSCFVTGGIHDGIDGTGLQRLYAESNATPTFVTPAFRW